MYEFAVTPAITQLRRPGVLITEVADGSLATELELAPGDRIVRVNGRAVRDYLDFRFQTAGEIELGLQIKKPNGETWSLEIEREEGEDFGLTFEQIVPRQCANECLFCFCKGNPADARPSLFVRDEDIRLSFLYGNYTTLSSITDDEMRRIVEQRLSPQYVSVHATDLKTRAYLLGVDEKRADISGKLKTLLDNDIEIHAQIVLCPEINDGKQLEKTLRDLAAHYPKVVSAAIVPVALTRYNTDERLTRVTPEFCRRTIAEVERLQKQFRRNLGVTFAFLGDEIYVKAGLPIPSRKHYGNYPQIEDGVGMIRSFSDSFEKLLKKLSKRRNALATVWTGSENMSETPVSEDKFLAPKVHSVNVRTHSFAIVPKANSPNPKSQFPNSKSRSGTFLTGEMFAPILREHIEKLNALTGSRFHVLGVPNTYFGGDVAVAGLLTGQDFLAVKDKIKGDFAVIPKTVIKSDEPILLDGMKYDDLKAQFNVPIYDMDAQEFIAKILADDF
jgi:putative radical SAM enzyme (TIGR03279 family)